MLLNSDKGPDNGIVQVPCRHSTLVCVVVLLPPDWCRSEVTRAGEAARTPERRRATGESQSCQCPHSASGGESTTMCQAAAHKWVNVDCNHICVSYVLAKNWEEKKSKNMRHLCMCVLSSFFSVTVLFSSGSVQEMTQIQIKLQQAQSAKALSENMNKVLQVCSDFSATEWNISQNVITQKRCTWTLLTKLLIFYFYPKGGSGGFEGADHSVWIGCETWRCCIRSEQWLGEPAVWILCGFRIKENEQEKWRASQVHHDYGAESSLQWHPVFLHCLCPFVSVPWALLYTVNLCQLAVFVLYTHTPINNPKNLTFPTLCSVLPWLTCQTPSCPKMKLCSCCEWRCSVAWVAWRGSGGRSVSCRRSSSSVRVEWMSCRPS